VNTAITAAPRAHAAGLHPEEAGTDLLTGHGGILPRDDLEPATCTPAPASATAPP